MIRVVVSCSNDQRLAAARRFIESFPPAVERLLVEPRAPPWMTAFGASRFRPWPLSGCTGSVWLSSRRGWRRRNSRGRAYSRL